MGFNYANVWTALAAEHGDRIAVVCGDRTVTYRDFADRAGRLARQLEMRGVRPGDSVAIELVNGPEYLETFYAALLAGASPVNVNYRYLAGELAYLLDDAGATALVYDTAFASAVAGAVEGRDLVLVEVGERSHEAPFLDAAPYEAFLAQSPRGATASHRPTGDDLITIYTGGTTGMPKGVMWRNDDLYVALWQVRKPGDEPPDPVAWCRAGGIAPTCLPASPLMHGTALWISLTTLSGGGTVVLIDTPGLDAERMWDEVVAHDVRVLTIVGDAYARPMLETLDAHPDRWDLSSLQVLMSSGVILSAECKRRLLAYAPGAVVVDTLGSTEGVVARSVVDAKGATDTTAGAFAPRDGVRVISEKTGRDVQPGSGEVGLVAVGGRLPIGYRNDPVKSAQTFRVIDGRRYTVAGDHATVEKDGTIRLLGRGSACINTGGEKVFAEEVEMIFREHADVADCAIVGVPEPRWGEMVVALVQLVSGATTTSDDLDQYSRRRMAGYKRPKRMLFVDQLPRSASGKTDYPALRELAKARLA